MTSSRETCFDRSGTERRPVIMRRRLEVFTLGHARVLWSLRSPTVEAVPRFPEIDDCLVAGYVCGMPWRRALDQVQDQARTLRECQRWGRSCQREDIEAGALAILAFIRESIQFPTPLKREGAGSADAGLPWPWLCAWNIKARVSNPWDISSVEALSWWACHAAENGTEFVSDEIREAAAGVVVTPAGEGA
jgi:hypothetical protein